MIFETCYLDLILFSTLEAFFNKWKITKENCSVTLSKFRVWNFFEFSNRKIPNNPRRANFFNFLTSRQIRNEIRIIIGTPLLGKALYNTRSVEEGYREKDKGPPVLSNQSKRERERERERVLVFYGAWWLRYSNSESVWLGVYVYVSLCGSSGRG